MSSLLTISYRVQSLNFKFGSQPSMWILSWIVAWSTVWQYCDLVWSILGQSTHDGSSKTWKDPWLVSFEQEARSSGQASLSDPNIQPQANCSHQLPMYLAPRLTDNYTQKIPRAIFQTWKSLCAAGPHHFKTVTSFVIDNPEYEYYLFDDAAAYKFIKSFHPEHARLYLMMKLGAMKADIWRLAVIYRYGGVYLDTDTRSVAPLRRVIWPNASVVTGIGGSGDFHQWALLYAPRHVIIKSALKLAWHRAELLYLSEAGGRVSHATGPVAFQAGVTQALKAHKCTLPPAAFLRGPPYQSHEGRYVSYLPDHLCGAEVGVMQIFLDDYLGGNIQFKSPQAEAEMSLISLPYKQAQRNHTKMFKQAQPVRVFNPPTEPIRYLKRAGRIV